MTTDFPLAQNESAVSAFGHVISESFHWDTIGLQLLPVVLLVISLLFFVLGMVKREETARSRYAIIMVGLVVGILLSDIFCLTLAIARTLIDNTARSIPLTLTTYQVGGLLRVFAIILPVAGLTCLGALILSGKRLPKKKPA